MAEPVIVEAVRTPFGKRSGVFRDMRPDSLLAAALAGVIHRSRINPVAVEDVVAG